MRNIKLFLPVMISIMLLSAHGEAGACTDVFVNSGTEKVSGRNIDWPIGPVVRMSINPRGLSRTAVATYPTDQPLSWISQYGSVTLQLHLFGMYITLDGMNEHGLSVGMLMMLEAVYPPPDSQPYLNDDKWLLYYLDNCRTVAEAVALAPTIRVNCLLGSHLALHDPSGDSAVMEYVGGELKIYRSPVYNGALTNSPCYEDQLANLANYVWFGGDQTDLPGGVEATSRFVRASFYRQTLPEPESAEEAVGSTLAIMQNVAKPLFDRNKSCTRTTCLRNHTTRRYSWRSFCYPNLRYVDLSTVDLTPGNPIRVLDNNTDLVGDAESYFKPDPSQLVIPQGDYNGDGISDIAIFRAMAGAWSVRGITHLYFGSAEDLPVPADYNGDGTTNIGIYRGRSALWAVRDVTRGYFGGLISQPVPGDYNGDGTSEISVFQDRVGLWALRGLTRMYFGATGDVPIPGDYNGDGTDDIAVLRRWIGTMTQPGRDQWLVKDVSRFDFGIGMGIPVAGDYDGDGIWEAAVFTPDPSDSQLGRWTVRGLTSVGYGLADDLPVPADYAGDGSARPAVFREASGLWAVRDLTRCYFGSRYDLPITRHGSREDDL